MKDTNDENFDDGFDAGEATALSEVGDMLLDEGFDSGEIDELLYDPAPKKKSKRKRTTRRRSRRAYDPAPKKKRTYKKKAKGALAKFSNYALPVAAGGTFYTAYLTRAEELFKAGLIEKQSVVSAIEYDMKHFKQDDAMDRLKDSAPGIIGTAAAGMISGAAIKETKLAGKNSTKLGNIARDLLVGVALGKGAKAVLDPPIPGSPAAPSGEPAARIAASPAASGQPVTRPVTRTPAIAAGECTTCSAWEV